MLAINIATEIIKLGIIIRVLLCLVEYKYTVLFLVEALKSVPCVIFCVCS